MSYREGGGGRGHFTACVPLCMTCIREVEMSSFFPRKEKRLTRSHAAGTRSAYLIACVSLCVTCARARVEVSSFFSRNRKRLTRSRAAGTRPTHRTACVSLCVTCVRVRVAPAVCCSRKRRDTVESWREWANSAAVAAADVQNKSYAL